MEDVQAAALPSRELHHPFLIGALALPGALAGGALAPMALSSIRAVTVPEELAIFLGAFLGAALSLRVLRGTLSALARIPDRAASGPRIALAPLREASALHLVSADEETRIAGGVAMLAITFLERGDRVLVIDAGLGSPLHAWLGGVPRLGLAECLCDQVPVLGLVQTGPTAGLWLLARGGSRRFDAWSRLGRVLDEACSHFDRVIVAAPASTLPSLGYGLATNEVAGWWATSSRRAALPKRALSRFGMSLSRLALPPRSELTPQAVLRALAAIPARPGPPTVPVAAPKPPRVQVPKVEPAVLDCDLQVRERLRFLVWMRRIQDEHRAESETALAAR